MYLGSAASECKLSRAPHGARGLKFILMFQMLGLVLSGSTRSPWIEIVIQWSFSVAILSRAPHGARGLK